MKAGRIFLLVLAVLCAGAVWAQQQDDEDAAPKPTTTVAQSTLDKVKAQAAADTTVDYVPNSDED